VFSEATSGFVLSLLSDDLEFKPSSHTGCQVCRLPQKQLAEITNSLMNGSVTSIDILHMPDRIETRASVNPGNLEKWSQCRITINRVSEWAGRDELIATMKSTKILPSSQMPDLRSVIIFNGDDGKRIGALYFGRFFGRYFGQFGSSDGAVGN
jgi:hypothetical protein